MDTRSLDRLGDEIAELSAHLDAATARLLDLIREFDQRAGWNNGFRSCAAWLSWRVGIDIGAARERVRVAHALETLPQLAQALARGELSYAKVRALTRVATPETEERLLAVGRAGTADHVERIVRGWRRMDLKAEAAEDARRYRNRSLEMYHGDDGMLVVRGRRQRTFPRKLPPWRNSKRMPWGYSPRRLCITASNPARPASDTRSSCTSMLRCLRSRMHLASPLSSTAGAFLRKRLAVWHAMRAVW